MTMELEGNLSLERAHTRRWMSIVGVIIPVAAVVLLAAWFVRVYVAPLTVAIPNPMMMMADDLPAPGVSARTEIEAQQPPMAMAEPTTPLPAAERRVPASALP